ncbi:mitochondrial import receptor subunit tom-20 [Histoplasma ohiense]|nr:mitochondrial import receptor subunit tom-20 [Histoplasma ohiense (nom. inval.)]
MKTTTIVAASAGTILTGFLAYAIYFDYKRHSDAEFRRNLKRDNRRLARAVREESAAQGARQIAEIKEAVLDAKAEGFPTDPDDKERYFMGQIAKGEQLAADGSSNIEAALAFYKALKVYPQPKDLITIYDTTVPKDVLEILAEMVGQDTSLQLGSFTGGSSTGSSSGGADHHGVE